MSSKVRLPDDSETRMNDRRIHFGSVRIPIYLASAIWAILIMTGLLLSVDFQTRPADVGVTPTQWPDSIRLKRSEAQTVLLMFVHPHCPCSRASLTEFAELLNPLRSDVKAYVLFFDSSKFNRPANQSESWRQAQAIPNVVIESDDNGELSRKFGAHTSGYVVMYDKIGRLQFAGGITASRGQVGKNSGTNAVSACLSGQEASCRLNPVFGCPILTVPQTREGTVQ